MLLDPRHSLKPARLAQGPARLTAMDAPHLNVHMSGRREPAQPCRSLSGDPFWVGDPVHTGRELTVR